MMAKLFEPAELAALYAQWAAKFPKEAARLAANKAREAPPKEPEA